MDTEGQMANLETEIDGTPRLQIPPSRPACRLLVLVVSFRQLPGRVCAVVIVMHPHSAPVV